MKGINKKIIWRYEKARQLFNDKHKNYVFIGTFLNLSKPPYMYEIYFTNLTLNMQQSLFIPVYELKKFKIKDIVEIYEDVYQEIATLNNWSIKWLKRGIY